jgi:hypothetical protein
VATLVAMGLLTAVAGRSPAPATSSAAAGP